MEEDRQSLRERSDGEVFNPFSSVGLSSDFPAFGFSAWGRYKPHFIHRDRYYLFDYLLLHFVRISLSTRHYRHHAFHYRRKG